VDEPWAALGRRTRDVAHALAGDLVRRRDPILAGRRARSLVDARSGRVDRDPLNRFGLMMDVSERHGLRSVFYFMAGNAPDDHDFRYQLSDPPFAELLRRIHERGHEIGLHASYGSYLSEERTTMEFAALKAACRVAGFDQPSWGVRQHYLRFEAPQTWRNQESAGLEHDSTLGFAERVGFRAGTCREYPVFDLLDRRRLGLRERPLVVMDGTLFEYMGLDLDAAALRIRAVVGACRQHRGDAVLLYHNTTLAGDRNQAHYREIVEELVRPS
jgi:peptidoglycan/xylan/chitin deacetylase (PgdA/CDA1 family)